MPEVRAKIISSPKIRTEMEQEVQRRLSLFQERDRIMHQIRRYRLMRHKPYVPTAYQARLGGENAVKLPIMYRLVQTAVTAVSKKAPVIYNQPVDQRDERAAEELDRADSLLLQAVDAQSSTPWLYGLFMTLFGDGLGVTKTVLGPWGNFPIPEVRNVVGGPDEIVDAEEYNEAVAEFLTRRPLPFSTRIVDPLTCYPALNEYGDGVFIESGMRSTQQSLRQLGLFVDPDHNNTIRKLPEGKPYSEYELPQGAAPSIRVTELWDNDHCIVLADGFDDIVEFENVLGESPYEYGFGDPTGVEDPTNIGMSVAFPIYYIVPWIDTEVGIMTAWSIFAAPTPYTTQDPMPGVKPTQETSVVEFEPGKMYHFPTGRKVGILSPPPVGAEVTAFLQFLISSANSGGLPEIVSGGGVGSRLPALTFQAAFEAATDRLRPATKSAERIIGGTLTKMHKLIARYDVPIYVNGRDFGAKGDKQNKRGWAVIKPSEARKGRTIAVSLALESTQDLIAKGTHSAFMVNAKLWDRETAQRFAGVDNPQEVDDKIGADLAWEQTLPLIAQSVIAADPDLAALLEEGGDGGGGGGEEEAGVGRQAAPKAANRSGTAAQTTREPRGNRPGPIGQTFGRS